MAYIQFYALIPDIAATEMRMITVPEPNEYGILPGEYELFEIYCNDTGCDCRRVFLAVTPPVTQEPVAVISFGWETHRFYSEWLNVGKNFSAVSAADREAVNLMRGIHLIDGSQSRAASAVLKMVTEQALNDHVYIDMLKEHYEMFRSVIGAPDSTD
jgi:hypothetical protein